MFEDGETIMLRGVEGMGVLEGFKPQVPDGVEVPTSVNGMLFKVKVINFNSFFIGDTRGFDKYVRGGLAKLVKVPQDIAFEPYHEVYQTATPKFEANLEYHDFMKVDHPRILHLAFLSLEDFYATHKRLPEPFSFADAKQLLALVQKRQEATPDFVGADKLPAIKKLISRFAMTLGGNFGPQSAFIGGLVCQEIVKAITGKFKPIVQTLYADSIEVLDERLFPENVFELKDEEFNSLVDQSGVKPKNHRDDGVRILLGQDLLIEL